MEAQIVDFDAKRIGPYLMRVIEGFLGDPPDSAFQRGYLSAIVSAYREGLGRGAADARLLKAEEILGR